MRRDTLGLADDSLFIEILNHACTVADALLRTGLRLFSKERAFGFDSTPFQGAIQFPDSDADAPAISGALLVPVTLQGLSNPGAVRKNFSRNLTAALENQSFPFILCMNKLNFIHGT